MFYGVSGYQEDRQAWEQANSARQAWEARAAQLQQQWSDYQQAQAAAVADCETRTATYQRSVASRSAYIPRYEADLANCRTRQQKLTALNAEIQAWKQRHGIVGSFTSAPCFSSAQAKAYYQSMCEQQTQLRGLPSGLGAAAFMYADEDAAFRSAIEKRTSENLFCVIGDLPLCPWGIPNCEGLTAPGPAPNSPTCTYPKQPPSMTTLGPAPPLPGTPPTPPDEPGPPPLPPPVFRTDDEPASPPPEEEDDGSSSFAMYGILALLLLGGGYLVYRTVK
jgi:hypothetical protein